MSAVTSFKVAFLSRCAEEGLTIEQIHERVKTAVAKAESKYGQVKEAGVGSLAFKGLKGLGKLLGLGAAAGTASTAWGLGQKAVPHIGGGVAGWAASGGDPTAAALGAIAGPSASEKGWSWPLLGLGLAGLAGGGLAAGKFMAGSQEDPMAEEEIKSQELANEYRRLADRTRMAAKRRKLLEGKGGF